MVWKGPEYWPEEKVWAEQSRIARGGGGTGTLNTHCDNSPFVHSALVVLCLCGWGCFDFKYNCKTAVSVSSSSCKKIINTMLLGLFTCAG